MNKQIHCCEMMNRAIESQEIPINFSDRYREYGVNVLDGGTSSISIEYCPWCAKKLPESLRDRWFDELEKIGLEPGDENIPEKFLGAQWYLNGES